MDDRAVCHQYASGTYTFVEGRSQPPSVYHLDLIEMILKHFWSRGDCAFSTFHSTDLDREHILRFGTNAECCIP